MSQIAGTFTLHVSLRPFYLLLCVVLFIAQTNPLHITPVSLEHFVGVSRVHGDGEYSRTFCMRTRGSMGMVNILEHFVVMPGGPWEW